MDGGLYAVELYTRIVNKIFWIGFWGSWLRADAWKWRFFGVLDPVDMETVVGNVRLTCSGRMCRRLEIGAFILLGEGNGLIRISPEHGAETAVE